MQEQSTDYYQRNEQEEAHQDAEYKRNEEAFLLHANSILLLTHDWRKESGNCGPCDDDMMMLPSETMYMIHTTHDI